MRSFVVSQDPSKKARSTAQDAKKRKANPATTITTATTSTTSTTTTSFTSTTGTTTNTNTTDTAKPHPVTPPPVVRKNVGQTPPGSSETPPVPPTNKPPEEKKLSEDVIEQEQDMEETQDIDADGETQLGGDFSSTLTPPDSPPAIPETPIVQRPPPQVLSPGGTTLVDPEALVDDAFSLDSKSETSENQAIDLTTLKTASVHEGGSSHVHGMLCVFFYAILITIYIMVMLRLFYKYVCIVRSLCFNVHTFIDHIFNFVHTTRPSCNHCCCQFNFHY
jgi:hypothetical protein